MRITIKTSTAFRVEFTTDQDWTSTGKTVASILAVDTGPSKKKTKAKVISISAKEEVINISIKYLYNQY